MTGAAGEEQPDKTIRAPLYSSSSDIVNPLHLHIECTQGISARSLLDGLRTLARSSGETHSKDALQIDPMSASIWMQHIPDNDRVVLQDHQSLNKEMPVQSWEPFRKAVRESPVEVSERVICQLKDLLDALELYYDDEVKQASPLYPSVVWHMMAVVLLLDRLRIRSMSSSAVPKQASGCLNPEVLATVLQNFPPATSSENAPETLATTTLDGAILLKVLQPESPVEPDRVFHSKATGRDGKIKTELGLTFDRSLANKAPPPPEMAPIKGSDPPGSDRPMDVEAPKVARAVATAPPPEATNPARQKAPHVQPPRTVPPPTEQPPQQPQNAKAAAVAAAPGQQSEPQQHQARATPATVQPTPGQATRAVAVTAPPPRPQQDQTGGGLESPLWNVEKTLTLLQTNIDDMTAEHLSFCTELLLQQGASDVWLTPIIMKKGRAAHELNCLTHDHLTQALLVTIFRQTTTLGVRVWTPTAGLQRISLRREMVTVEYCRRQVSVKVAYLGPEPVSLKPEYDQCAALAKETGIPVLVVTEEVKAMAKDATRKKLMAAAAAKR